MEIQQDLSSDNNNGAVDDNWFEQMKAADLDYEQTKKENTVEQIQTKMHEINFTASQVNLKTYENLCTVKSANQK